MRIIHNLRVFHDAVTDLRFDDRGDFIVVVSKFYNKVYIIDGKPSKAFEPVGFVGK